MFRTFQHINNTQNQKLNLNQFDIIKNTSKNRQITLKQQLSKRQNNKDQSDRKYVLQIFKQLIDIVNKNFEEIDSAKSNLKTIKQSRIPLLKRNKISFKSDRKSKQIELIHDHLQKQHESITHRKILNHNNSYEQNHFQLITKHLKQQILDNYSVVMEYQIEDEQDSQQKLNQQI